MMSLGRSCIGTASGKEPATSGAATSVIGASEIRMTLSKMETLPQRLSYRPPCQAYDLGGEDAVIRDEANAGRRTLPLAQIAERTNAPVPMPCWLFRRGETSDAWEFHGSMGQHADAPHPIRLL